MSGGVYCLYLSHVGVLVVLAGSTPGTARSRPAGSTRRQTSPSRVIEQQGTLLSSFTLDLFAALSQDRSYQPQRRLHGLPPMSAVR